MDHYSDYVCFTVKSEYDPHHPDDPPKEPPGTNYDIKRNDILKGWWYFDKDDQQLISSTEKLTFYAINKHTGKGWSIVPFV